MPTAPSSASPRSALHQLTELLHRNIFFGTTLVVLLLVVFFVPQIRNVMWQTVDTGPGISISHLWSKSTLEAAGFLTFLSALAVGTVASLLFVVPPSFLSKDGQGADPIRPPRLPNQWRLVVLLLLLVLLPIFVILPLPQGALLLVSAVLLFRPMGRLISQSSGWLAWVAEHLGPGYRRLAGLVLIAASLLVGVPLLLAWPGENSGHIYPLAGTAVVGAGLLAFLTGLWLALLPKTGEPGTVYLAQGRLLGWLLFTALFGEVLWFLADCSVSKGLVSYRLYTIWAVLELLVLGVLIGSLLDTWQLATGLPIRAAAVLFAMLIVFVMRVPSREPLEKSEGAPPLTNTPDDWPRFLLGRIQTVPLGEPVVIVACSGGGSRAAIFTTLVLETLGREPFRKDPKNTWADHIVLVSGVSGGSLGTARFVEGYAGGDWDDELSRQERQDLRHSVKRELLARTADWGRYCSEDLEKQKTQATGNNQPDTDPDSRIAMALKEATEISQRLLEDSPKEGDPSWAARSGLVDDMCTDFMAPILRGALVPGLSRGASLRSFWKEQFHWAGRCDRSGSYSQVPGEAKRPLVVYNTCNVRGGTRVAIGFPPLPPKLLGLPLVSGVRSEDAPRNTPEALADIDSDRLIEPAQAVGLSACFPWGFNVTTLARASASQSAEPLVGMLDGGFVDNTGIDTLFLLLQATKLKAQDKNGGAPAEPYRQLWQELMNRRVVLIEVDSGAKPSDAGAVTRALSALLEPIDALDNTGYTNAQAAKQHYLADLTASLRRQQDSGELQDRVRQMLEHLPANPASSQEMREWRVRAEAFGKKLAQPPSEDDLRGFFNYRFECNHVGDPNVLTAWSLGPDDKALTLLRFLTEELMVMPLLREFARQDDPLLQARQVNEAELGILKRDGLISLLKRLADEEKTVLDLFKAGAKSEQTLRLRLESFNRDLDQAKALARQLELSDDPRAVAAFGEVEQSLKAGQDYLKAQTPQTQQAAEKAFAGDRTGQFRPVVANLQMKQQSEEKKVHELSGNVQQSGRLQAESDRLNAQKRKTFDQLGDRSKK
jgi:hypothetical protein